MTSGEKRVVSQWRFNVNEWGGSIQFSCTLIILYDISYYNINYSILTLYFRFDIFNFFSFDSTSFQS